MYSKTCLKRPVSVAQSLTFLTTDAHLTADPGVESSIPAQSHIFWEIDHEIIGEELYKLHASVLILILLFQFVITLYKLI